MSADDQLGKLVEELMKNPLVTGAATTVFGAREKATQAQETLMAALNLPSSGDVERLTRRVRSVSQRLEGVEDNLERVLERLDRIATRLDAIEARLGDGNGDAPPAPRTPRRRASGSG